MIKMSSPLFDEAELRGLVGGVRGAAVLDCFYDKDNWCVVMGRQAA